MLRFVTGICICHVRCEEQVERRCLGETAVDLELLTAMTGSVVKRFFYAGELQWLHLFDFSPVCVLKGVLIALLKWVIKMG